jgi:predicted DCC family thiol-disulfide oxidoreductase YuxK
VAALDPATPLLVFDGDCGFCTRTLGWLRLIDRRRIINSVPFQRPGVPESLGLTREQCAESVQWRGPDGRRAEGAEAISAALDVALRTRWPGRLHARTAGVQARMYELVARNRHRLPGVTPWCSRYPDDCGRS